MSRTYALVLAGGQSVRMGVDKARVRVPAARGTQTLLAHVVTAVSPCVDEAFVITSAVREPEHRALVQGLACVVVAEPGAGEHGPRQALRWALHSLLLAPGSIAILTACDVWGIATPQWRTLLDTLRHAHTQAAVAMIDESAVVQPLISAVRIDALRSALDSEPSAMDLRSVMASLGAAPVELEGVAPGDQRSPNDTLGIRAIWRGRALPGRLGAGGLCEGGASAGSGGTARLSAAAAPAIVACEVLSAVILAAGKGTRMKSDRPKVLATLAGHSLLDHVLERSAGAGVGRTIVVVGHGAAEVMESVRGSGRVDVEFATQAEQRGTGHAVQCALGLLAGEDGPVLILAGDVPLIRTQTLEALVHAATEAPSGVALVGFCPPDPHGYGRLIFEHERLRGIVEERDASETQRAIDVCNAGIYCVPAKRLGALLAGLQPHNAQGELYLTDIVAQVADEGVAVVRADWREVVGVNTPEQLAEVEALIADIIAADGGRS